VFSLAEVPLAAWDIIRDREKLGAGSGRFVDRAGEIAWC
jgi:hypothetical protein